MLRTTSIAKVVVTALPPLKLFDVGKKAPTKKFNEQTQALFCCTLFVFCPSLLLFVCRNWVVYNLKPDSLAGSSKQGKGIR